MASTEAGLAKTPEPLDPENFWQRFGTTIAQDVKSLAEKATYDKEQWAEKLWQGERRFIEQVLNQVKQMKQKTNNADALVLFDVDETLASAQYTDATTVVTTLRPSATSLFSILKENGLRVGFLTSRKDEPLRAELETGSMKGLHEHVDYEHFYGRDAEKGVPREMDSRMFGERLLEEFGGPEGFLDDEYVKETETYKGAWWQGGAMVRLHMIKKLREKIKGPFMVVDDLHYPHILTGKKGAYGVELDDDSKFFGPR